MIGPCGLIIIVFPLGQNHDFIITSMIAFVVICATHDYMTTWLHDNVANPYSLIMPCNPNMVVIISVSPCDFNNYGHVWCMIKYMIRHVIINIQLQKWHMASIQTSLTKVDR
jgi:hypothetical protein